MTTDERVARLARTVMELIELLNGGPNGTGPLLSDDPSIRMELERLSSEIAALWQD